MPKWSKDDTIFPVKVAYSRNKENRLGRIVIPKPILKDMLFPKEVIFEKRDGKILLRAG